MMKDATSRAAPAPADADALREDMLHALKYSVGKDRAHATIHDWRVALSRAIRDRVVDPWFGATRRTYAAGAKRVHYLSMEFLIGRLLEDCAVNLRLDRAARRLHRAGARL
ncbi:MAG: hypothetical protein KatS3mg118_2560 [Paracoccaceae bacterium]|nr:MAG: hypothetical protein KatS3mg118_2560 [Paracoccaceae bacterium]